MALLQVQLLKMAERLGLTGVVPLALDLWQSTSSGRGTAYIKERSPAGIRVLRLPNAEARIPAMGLQMLPYLILSAGRRLSLAAQNRKELQRASELVGHFRLSHLDLDRNRFPLNLLGAAVICWDVSL